MATLARIPSRGRHESVVKEPRIKRCQSLLSTLSDDQMVEAGILLDLSSGRVAGIVAREAAKPQDCGELKLQRIRQLRELTREIICVATELGSVWNLALS